MKKKETLFDILLEVSELRMDIETAEKRILRLLDVVGRSEQLVCDHPEEALIRDKPTDYCMACGKNI